MTEKMTLVPTLTLLRDWCYMTDLPAYSLILREREKQFTKSFWLEHDDNRCSEEMAIAAAILVMPPSLRTKELYSWWPGPQPKTRPAAERIDELVEAGALIVAEINRLRRLQVKELSATERACNVEQKEGKLRLEE